jgi:hypothetical protein
MTKIVTKFQVSSSSLNKSLYLDEAENVNVDYPQTASSSSDNQIQALSKFSQVLSIPSAIEPMKLRKREVVRKNDTLLDAKLRKDLRFKCENQAWNENVYIRHDLFKRNSGVFAKRMIKVALLETIILAFIKKYFDDDTKQNKILNVIQNRLLLSNPKLFAITMVDGWLLASIK